MHVTIGLILILSIFKSKRNQIFKDLDFRKQKYFVESQNIFDAIKISFNL